LAAFPSGPPVRGIDGGVRHRLERWCYA
jgi:hypothetical protein